MTFRTVAKLADGRDLIYYDSVPNLDRSAPDRRPADSTDGRGSRSEIRWNPLLKEYAVIAGHRQSRTFKPERSMCPLDPTSGTMQTEIPAADYEVVVFENRYAAFTLEAERRGTHQEGVHFHSASGNGRCEVICFSSDHTAPLAMLPHRQLLTVIDAWVDRTLELSKFDSIEYVYCFENRGEEIGVTLSHPHGQIYGYPFLPARFARILDAYSEHKNRTGNCLQCDLMEAELDSGERIVASTPHWVAYVPFAARWPYEVSLVPRRHLPDLPALTGDEREDLAAVYSQVLRAFDGLFETAAPYIAGWHQAPPRTRQPWHLAAEIFTIRRASNKLKYLAGSESGATVWINDIQPEQAASELRKNFGLLDLPDPGHAADTQ